MAQEKNLSEKSTAYSSGYNTYSEDEIDLYELITVLIKRKKIIFASAAFFVIVAAVLVFFVISPKYKIGAIVRPGIAGFDNDGNPIYDWAPQDLKNWISSEAYVPNLYEKFDDQLAIPKVFAKVPRRGRVVELYFFYPQPDKGKMLMKEILDNFSTIKNKSGRLLAEAKHLESVIQDLKEEKTKLNVEKKEVDNQINDLKQELKVVKGKEEKIKLKISETKDKIKNTEKTIYLTQNSIKNINSIKAKLEKKLIFIDKNTEQLISQRMDMLKAKQQFSDPISILLFSNIIQDNLVYASNLDLRIMNLSESVISKMKKIEDLKLKKEALINTIKELEIELNTNLKKKEDEILSQIKDLKLQKEMVIPSKIKSIDSKIEELKSKLNLLSPIEIIQDVYSTPKPVKPKKKLVILVALISGLFIGVFLAFFTEFWEQRRAKEQAES